MLSIFFNFMKTKKIPLGVDFIDSMLKGGIEKDIITSIYGPAGSGKTLFCIHACISVVREGKKVIYVDTEGGFSVERLKQMDEDYDLILKHMTFLKPTTFEEQKEVFEMLKKYLVISDTQKNSNNFSNELKFLTTNDIGLIVIDTVSMLYRLELGKSDKVYPVNKELGQQIACLNEIARKKNIPVLLTNQVYADFDVRDKVKIVGGELLKYSSKCLIEMTRLNNIRKFVIIKHRSIPENLSCEFEIKEKGLKEKK